MFETGWQRNAPAFSMENDCTSPSHSSPVHILTVTLLRLTGLARAVFIEAPIMIKAAMILEEYIFAGL